MHMLKTTILAILIIGAAVLSAVNSTADEFKVIPSVALKGEYNDNIFFTAKDEKDDYIGTISPGLEIIERTERLDLNLTGALDVIEYADNDELSAVDYDYKARLGYGLTPRLNVKTHALYAKSTQPDRDVVETGLVQDTQRRLRQLYGGGLEYTLTEKAAAALSYFYQDDDWDSDDPNDEDLTINSADMLYTYNISRWFESTIGRLNFGYANFDYETTETDYYFGTLGFLHHFSEIYSIQADAGTRYTDSEFDNDQDDQNWGGRGSLGLIYNGEFTKVDLTASRDIMAASGRTGTVERTEFVFDARHRVLEKLWAGLSAGYYLNKSDADEFSSQEIDEATIRIRPNIFWEITQYLTLKTSYKYTYVDDDDDDKTRTRNLVFVELTFAYPVIE